MHSQHNNELQIVSYVNCYIIYNLIVLTKCEAYYFVSDVVPNMGVSDFESDGLGQWMPIIPGVLVINNHAGV